MLPSKFVNKTGNYSVDVNGEIITVKLADCPAAIDQFICSYLSQYNVFGIDCKKVVPAAAAGIKSVNTLLVLCGGPGGAAYNYCLIINLSYLTYIPKSLRKLLGDENRCFISASTLDLLSDFVNNGTPKSIEAGDLAARVLNKPDLLGSSLFQTACVVGVPQDVKQSSLGHREIHLEQKYARVLTPEQVKKVVVDAYACCKIGIKLLDSDQFLLVSQP